MNLNSRSAQNHHLRPYVRPPTLAAYQIGTAQLARDLPQYLEFLRTPPMNMVNIVYKRLSNGRFVVEKKELVEDMPTEIATEVDPHDQDVLKYFDMDVEFGEEDMEIDDDFIDKFAKPSQEEESKHVNALTCGARDISRVQHSQTIVNAAQGANNTHQLRDASGKDD